MNTAAHAFAVRASRAFLAPDAIQLLKSDHAAVKKLFRTYEQRTKDRAEPQEREFLALQICAELRVHMMIEEEIFYPAARDVLRDRDLVDEAEVEHADAKDLITNIEDADPRDDKYDARIKVLAELIDHHVRKEHDELFPQVAQRGMDTAEVGVRLEARRHALRSELGLSG